MAIFNFEVNEGITTLKPTSFVIKNNKIFYNGPYYYEVKILLDNGTCYIGLKTDIILNEETVKEKMKALITDDYIFHSFYEIDEKYFKNCYPKEFNC